MGIWSLESIEKECVCRTSSRSLELSLSLGDEDIGYNSGDIQTKPAMEWDAEWSAKVRFAPSAFRDR